MARILLVDDDPDILTLGRTVLASAGHDVLTAPDALTAMDTLQTKIVDAVITDANMPLVSGFELVKTMRTDKRFAHFPIAMLTGRRERKDIERALQAGVDDYIVKPLDPMIFLKKIEDLFRKRPLEARAEVKFAQATSSTIGRILLEMEIKSISEAGLVLKTQHPLAENERIELSTSIFQDMGTTAPLMKVLSSVKVKEGEYECRISFVGADDTFLQKVRAWVVAHTPRIGKGA